MFLYRHAGESPYPEFSCRGIRDAEHCDPTLDSGFHRNDNFANSVF
jgi:hypothetical protein